MKTNFDKMTVTLERRQVIDLMMACITTEFEANDGGAKWAALHDELKRQLDEFDAE